MTIDAQLMAWYARVGETFAPLTSSTPEARRQRYEEITDLLDTSRPRAHVGVRDFQLALPGRSLPARLYHPGGTPALMVFFHGGGWVVGSLHSHDRLCAHVAAHAGVAVLSVQYRKAPEHPFPAPVDDAYDAVCWAAAHADELACDTARLAVGGDSAGAHLAAVTAITARDRATPALCYQWLVYPTIDPRSTLPSRSACAGGPGLTIADMDWFWAQFGADADANDYRVAPCRAASLAGLPAAYVITAEADLLRDEGEQYAAQLRQAGVPVTLCRAAGMTHGFARLYPVSQAADALMNEAIAALGAALRGTPTAQQPGQGAA